MRIVFVVELRDLGAQEAELEQGDRLAAQVGVDRAGAFGAHRGEVGEHRRAVAVGIESGGHPEDRFEQRQRPALQLLETVPGLLLGDRQVGILAAGPPPPRRGDQADRQPGEDQPGQQRDLVLAERRHPLVAGEQRGRGVLRPAFAEPGVGGGDRHLADPRRLHDVAEVDQPARHRSAVLVAHQDIPVVAVVVDQLARQGGQPGPQALLEESEHLLEGARPAAGTKGSRAAITSPACCRSQSSQRGSPASRPASARSARAKAPHARQQRLRMWLDLGQRPAFDKGEKPHHRAAAAGQLELDLGLAVAARQEARRVDHPGEPAERRVLQRQHPRIGIGARHPQHPALPARQFELEILVAFAGQLAGARGGHEMFGGDGQSGGGIERGFAGIGGGQLDPETHGGQKIPGGAAPLRWEMDGRPHFVEFFLEQGFELAETHISWVLLGPRDVYKIKKPIDLGFLDFSTLERRRRACEAEVALNGRLAPAIYLGVEAIVARGPGFGFVAPQAGAPEVGAPVEWTVHMVRLPEARRADRLLAAGTLGAGELERLAARLAAFHREARADGDTAAGGALEVVRRNVAENFAQGRKSLERCLSPAEGRELERWQLGFLAENAELFARRAAAGRVRDGHGDLRLDHVYFLEAGGAERLVVVDCIEFNERFRVADVAADVAFLAMDLTRSRRPDLAEIFLAAYAREADDFGLYGVVDFYESYRAHVRAKIAGFVADGPGSNEKTRGLAEADARRFYLLALAGQRRRCCRRG